jgi:hypothetical protein
MALSKEQIQYLVLGGIVGAGALYAAITFGLAPLLSSISSAGTEIAELETKIESAQSFIRRREEIKREYETARSRIRAASKKIPLPVYKNYLMNMKKTILGLAEGLDLTVDEVADYDQPLIRDGQSQFKQYRVRVNVQASFAVLLAFLRRIEEHNPYLAVTLVSVTPQEATPEVHQAALILSWLVWVEPADRPVFEDDPEEDRDIPRAAP